MFPEPSNILPPNVVLLKGIVIVGSELTMLGSRSSSSNDSMASNQSESPFPEKVVEDSLEVIVR